MLCSQKAAAKVLHFKKTAKNITWIFCVIYSNGNMDGMEGLDALDKLGVMEICRGDWRGETNHATHGNGCRG